MPKIGDLLRRLRRGGFALVRHGKKHDIYEDAVGRRVVVPRHKTDIPSGLYYSLLREAGLGED